MATILPEDWRTRLEEAHTWLERSAAEADHREQAFRERCATAEAVVAEVTPTSLRGLPAKMQSLESTAAEADAAAEACESHLREIVRRSEELRRRLAAEVGRAIG